MQAGQTQTQDDLTRAAALQNQLSTQAASPEVSFDQRPTYSTQIGVNDDFSARFQLTNNSPVIRNGYVMIGFTPSGTTNTREFYRPISMPPGTTIRDIVITNAQMRAGGVTPGNYQLSFLAYNEQDQKIGNGFFGNPFSFGLAVPAVGSAPTYSPQINPGQDLVSTWAVSNTGDSTATITLLTVVTPAGTTDSQEFYRTGVAVPAGGGNLQMTVTAAQLSAVGFGAGRYLLTFVAFDSAGNRIGEFFGKPLTIGSADVHLEAPSIPTQIGANDSLTVDFQTTNSGNFSDPLTALVVFTPVGSTDPADSIEMYVSGMSSNPGRTFHSIMRTGQQLRNLGVNPGRWLITVTAFNALDERLESYYGHLMTIGDIRVTLPTQPALPSSVGISDDFTAQFTFVNAGDTADRPVTALLVFTPVGATDPAQSKEFYIKDLVTPPGSSTHDVTVSAADLAAAGITPGNWLVTATAFDGAGTRLQDYFGNFLTIGTVTPSFTSVPTYRRQIPAGGDFLATFDVGNTGDAPGRMTLVTSITPVGATDPAASREFSLIVTVQPGGGLFDFEIPGSALSGAGLTVGDHVVSFVVLDAAGNRVGEFFGNLFRIGDASLTVPAAPAYSDRVGSSEDFTAQWTFGNSGSVSADVSVLTVFTRVGTGNSIEVYRDGLVPANGGGTVNILLSPADRAAAGITAGDYTLTFKAFDANGNIIAEFFGNPLAIGEAALTLPAQPSYTDSIPLDGDLGSSWTLGNSGNSSGEVTLVASVTPLGGTDADTVEFRKVVSIPTGGETVSFVVTNAELDAAGITGGRYLVSFVAFDPAGTRLGEFFGNALRVGTITPTFPAVPAYDDSIAVGAAFESDWTLGNTGDAPDRVALIVSITPVGATDPAATKEFSKIIALPAGGATAEVNITSAELQAAGIGPGDYVVSFTALNGLSQVIGQFFGNPLTIGTASPTVGSEPAYTAQIPLNGVLQTDWAVGNTGDAPATVTLVVALTPVGGDPSQTVEFHQLVQVPPGGSSFDFDLSAADRQAAGVTGGEYLASFVALDAAGNRIGEFFGNLVTVGTVAPSVGTVPSYDGTLATGAPLETDWSVANSGDAPAFVTLVIGVTPAGQTATAATVEFSKNVRIPPGGLAVDFDVTAQQLSDAGIGAGEWLLSFVALRPDGSRAGEFFGNVLLIGEASPSISAAPIYSNRIGSTEDFTAQWTLGNSGSVRADVTVLTVFTRVGTSDSIEYYQAGEVPPGGGVINTLLTPAQRSSLGIPAGDYTLAFVVFDANDQRIGQFFGQPLSIGESQASFSAMPEYTGQLLEGRNFESDWTLGNSAPTSGVVTLVTSITPAGSTQAVEFNRNVTVPPGGGNFHLEITVAELQGAGIVPGSYTVSFVAVDAAGNRLGEFLGNTLEVIPAGTPIGFLLGQQLTSGARSGLVESWEVPAGDPNESLLADRACSYDQAIAAISLLFSGQAATARDILDAMALLEAGTGRVSSMYSVGPQAQDFSAVYTGTNAWLGDALATYELVTGDARFRPMAERIAETLLSFRDPSTGLLRGGLDADGNALPWISTEHNLDAYSFLDDLAFVTGDSRWRQAADDLAAAIDTHLWSVSHFLNGFGDDLVSLDVQAYGGIYWLSRGDVARAETVRDFIENNLKVTVDVNGTPVTGYAPYRGDSFIWVEGTAVIGILDSFLGRFDSARAIAAAIEQFRAASGGLGYASSTQHTSASGADELFSSSANAASTGWGLILQSILEATPASSSAPTQDAAVVSELPTFSVSSLSGSGVFLPPTQGETKAPMSLYSQAAQQGFFNIAPGMFRLAWLSSGKRSDVSSDSFFSFLLEFLFG